MTADDKTQLHVGVPDILVGTWTYRSLLSNPDLNADFDSLEFGRGNIENKSHYVPEWVNGVDQRPVLIGSIVRTIPHPTGPSSKSTAPAGVVAQWIALKQDLQPG